jgi:DNA modification methylase
MGKGKHEIRPSERLFADDQRDLFEKSYEERLQEEKRKPVECLGMTFPNDEERRKHFLSLLREKLKDPEFRKIEGFPIGSDEDILALSDPPYYTACPNPFIADFIQHYGKPYDPSKPYSREPFAADVSEGKNDPIYNAHTYHTKVPHKAIMRYILHYTEPGDVIFDGFCGTGMTGVAAQLCDNKSAIKELGYSIDAHGTIKDSAGEILSRIGQRKCVLAELCTAATFIARGYSTSFAESFFAREAQRILSEVESSLLPFYSTQHKLSKQPGVIDFTVWSDIFLCENCGQPIVLWNAVIDPETRRRTSRDKIPCPYCKHIGNIRQMSREMETYRDPGTGAIAKRVKQEPIFIQYHHGGDKYEKAPEKSDRDTAKKCDEALLTLAAHYPVIEMPDGLRKAKDAYHLRGITHTHNFFAARNLIAFARLWQECSKQGGRLGHQLRFWLTSVVLGFTKLNRYFESSYSQVNRYMKGAFYVAPFISEVRPGYALEGKIKRLSKLGYAQEGNTIISTGSTTQLTIPDSSVDYIFTDPPFGRNIQYSELNFIWESWLGVRTNARQEAIVDETIDKLRNHYHVLMRRCFRECYRILKPGRWITVEFHNAENAIWTIIQDALLSTGFVVADVRVLDKKQITMQQWVGTNVVNKDLVISAYKPNGGLEERFKLTAGSEEGVWDFISTHLKEIPVFVSKDGQAEVIAERQNYLLFDRMVAFHVQRGVTVPLSAAEFYAGLAQRFSERDGMYFLPEQVAEYDKKRMTVRAALQLELFVIDESSAIQWLKQQLVKKPQTFQELHPQFLKEIGGWQKHEKPLELSELLEQNFLRYDGKGEVPNQIHSYLSTNFKELRNLPKDEESLRAKGKDRWYVPDPNKAGDLEKLRERSLLKEFEEYRASSQKRLKVFRLEAVRAGFKKAWQERDYPTIITVARKIPENVFQEDPKLLMWYDQALTRTGGE